MLLHLNVPCSGGGPPAYLELDKLPDGRYRATVGMHEWIAERQRRAAILAEAEKKAGSD